MHLSSYPLTVGVLLPTILMILGFVASAWYGKHVAAQFEEPPAAPAVVQR
jgi:protein-S-isoprenylcysteine O-methyltransferase Ste14